MEWSKKLHLISPLGGSSSEGSLLDSEPEDVTAGDTSDNQRRARRRVRPGSFSDSGRRTCSERPKGAATDPKGRREGSLRPGRAVDTRASPDAPTLPGARSSACVSALRIPPRGRYGVSSTKSVSPALGRAALSGGLPARLLTAQGGTFLAHRRRAEPLGSPREAVVPASKATKQSTSGPAPLDGGVQKDPDPLAPRAEPGWWAQIDAEVLVEEGAAEDQARRGLH